MSEEEYSELCYLLGKLKYCYAKSAINNETFRKRYEKISNEIEDILKVIIINGEEKD